MRVLVLFSGRILESRGTPSRSRNLTSALAARGGFEILLLSRDPEPEARERLPFAHRGIARGSQLEAVLAAATAQFRPHLIWGHTHKALAPLSGLPRDLPGLRAVDLHGDWAAERLEQSWRPLRRRLAGYLRARTEEHRYLRRIDAFTAVSEPLAVRLRRLGKPVAVLPGGVDPELFRPAPLQPSPEVRVGYAGNFRPYQGIEILLEAGSRLLARGEPFHFCLAGDSGPFPELEDRARRLLGKHLTLAGALDYDRVPALLGSQDVLVIPRPRSRTARYGFPSKLPEYLALGRPVVATRVGAQGRLIDHLENGLLIAPGSVTQLEEALLQLQDPELRRRLGEAGRAYAVSRLSWSRIGADLDRFLRRVTEVDDHR